GRMVVSAEPGAGAVRRPFLIGDAFCQGGECRPPLVRPRSFEVLTGLATLKLTGARVTPAGVAALRKALPKCASYTGPPPPTEDHDRRPPTTRPLLRCFLLSRHRPLGLVRLAQNQGAGAGS